MGLLKYDPVAQSFKMTNVLGIVAGGLKELKHLIDKDISNYQSIGWLIGICTGICGLISSYVLYSSYSKYMAKRRLQLEHEAEMATYIQLRRMPSSQVAEQGATCLICMVNPSNVIPIPCNHLGMCLDCFTELKNRQ